MLNLPFRLAFGKAHCNPLSHNDSFKYPVFHEEVDWGAYFPNIQPDKRIVRHLDIGMGYGGLTVALAALYPGKLVMGMEIRAKVIIISLVRLLENDFPHAIISLYACGMVVPACMCVCLNVCMCLRLDLRVRASED